MMSKDLVLLKPTEAKRVLAFIIEEIVVKIGKQHF
jgi:hypothetical protein